MDRSDMTCADMTLAMPEDAGYNVMFTPTVITAAKYAVIYRSFKEKGKYREMQQYLTDAGYHVVWKHKKLMILSR